MFPWVKYDDKQSPRKPTWEILNEMKILWSHVEESSSNALSSDSSNGSDNFLGISFVCFLGISFSDLNICFRIFFRKVLQIELESLKLAGAEIFGPIFCNSCTPLVRSFRVIKTFFCCNSTFAKRWDIYQLTSVPLHFLSHYFSQSLNVCSAVFLPSTLFNYPTWICDAACFYLAYLTDNKKRCTT